MFCTFVDYSSDMATSLIVLMPKYLSVFLVPMYQFAKVIMCFVGDVNVYQRTTKTDLTNVFLPISLCAVVTQQAAVSEWRSIQRGGV